MTPAARLASLLALYSPEVARQFRGARVQLRRHFPRGHELVFENHNLLGCGYSSSARGSGVIVSLVAYPRWVTLFFFFGTSLADPEQLLQGKGKLIRSIRLAPGLLRSPAVQALLRQAALDHHEALAAAPPLTLGIRAIARTRRARRPT